MKRAIAAHVMSSILRSFTSTGTGKDRYIEELGIGYARGGHLRPHLQSLGYSLDQLLQGEGRPWADSWRNRNRIDCSGRLPNICHGLWTATGRWEAERDRRLARSYRDAANGRLANHLKRARPYLFTLFGPKPARQIGCSAIS